MQVGWARGIGRLHRSLEPRLLVGLTLVALALAGSMSFWRASRVTVPVLVATHELVAGDVVKRDDIEVTEAQLRGRLAALAIAPTAVADVVGQTATESIHAGSLII